MVNTPLPQAEREVVRRSVKCGAPLGGEAWTKVTARRLGIEPTLNPNGRPQQRTTEPKP